MKKTTYIAGLSALALLGIAGTAQPAARTVAGVVYLLKKITVTQVTGMDFGVITRPSGTVTLTLDNANGLSGTANIIDSSTAATGVYTVVGSSVSTIGIGATDGGNVSGINFTDIKASYHGSPFVSIFGSPVGPVAAPATGKSLRLGGTLQITSAVTSGTYAPSLNIEVVYQ